MVFFIVILLSLAALYIIGSAGLGWLPLLGYCDDAERINTVLLNLSYSYLASVLFFCMIELLPQLLNERKAFKVFEKDLKSVYRKMGQMVSALKMMAETEVENEKLKIEDLSALSVCKAKYECSYVKTTTRKDNECGVLDSYKFIEYHSRAIVEELHGILELPASTMLQQELLTLLVEIKHSDIHNTCLHLKSPLSANSDFPILKFDQEVFDFLQLYLRFSVFIKDAQTINYTIIEDNQTDEVKQKLTNLCLELKSNGFDPEGIYEVHKNHCFLCMFALPEEYKRLVYTIPKHTILA